MWFIRGLGFVLAASIFFCIPAVIKQHVALKTATQYDGVVVGHKKYVANEGVTYGLEIEYMGQDFKQHTFINSPATNPPARAIGDKVRIFDFGNDKEPEVLAFQSMYLRYGIWFCISFCALGCFVAPALMESIYSSFE